VLTIGPAREGSAPDPLFTREQVAELFRVSPRTVQRWGKAGKLRSLRASDVGKLLAPANDPNPQAPPSDAGQPQRERAAT
jgi:hypothetical protein